VFRYFRNTRDAPLDLSLLYVPQSVREWQVLHIHANKVRAARPKFQQVRAEIATDGHFLETHHMMPFPNLRGPLANFARRFPNRAGFPACSKKKTQFPFRMETRRKANHTGVARRFWAEASEFSIAGPHVFGNQ